MGRDSMRQRIQLGISPAHRGTTTPTAHLRCTHSIFHEEPLPLEPPASIRPPRRPVFGAPLAGRRDVFRRPLPSEFPLVGFDDVMHQAC